MRNEKQSLTRRFVYVIRNSQVPLALLEFGIFIILHVT